MTMATSGVLRTGYRRLTSTNPVIQRSLTTKITTWLEESKLVNATLYKAQFSLAPSPLRSTNTNTSASCKAGFATQSIANAGDDDHNNESKRPSFDESEFNPNEVIADIYSSALWIDGRHNWDPAGARKAVDQYEQSLNFLLNHLQRNGKKHERASLDTFLSDKQLDSTLNLLSSETTERAMKAAVKMNINTYELSRRIRELERLIGSIGMTPLTDNLSLRLLEVNGKAGNVGRALSLLQLRKARGYPSHESEFIYAVRAIESAGLYLRKNRNVFVGDTFQPAIDNPTRWLDAILMNMHQRSAPLTTELANRMLNTYATTGKSGRALHFFYNVVRVPMDPTILPDVSPEDLQQQQNMPKFRQRRVKVKMKMRAPPPFHKIPSESSGLVSAGIGSGAKSDAKENVRMTKLERESESDWSLPLTAAFAFADSLSHGACGHPPVALDVVSWNIIIKACCYRGSLWRAFSILRETMPRRKIQPNTFTYNTILDGLARVGDKASMTEFLVEMTNKSIPVDSFTVQALVDGLLNVGDVAGAVTLVQDMFNQHNVVPPYTTHLKIIEFALANELTFEAKRHIYFLQQMWNWKPRPSDSQDFCRKMDLTKKNPKLSKESLLKLFAFFGEELKEEDFM